MRRKGPTPGRTFRPSSLSRPASIRTSCRPMVAGERGRGLERTPMPIPATHFMEHGDEHRRNILQHVLRFRAIEQGRVLAQLVCDLVNDETPAVRQGLVSFLQKRALFLDLQDAEWNPR